MSNGVNARFFIESVRLLDELYPRRLADDQMEEFRAMLAKAEAIYKGLPKRPEKKSIGFATEARAK
jgi:hypothetical protein